MPFPIMWKKQAYREKLMYHDKNVIILLTSLLYASKSVPCFCRTSWADCLTTNTLGLGE